MATKTTAKKRTTTKPKRAKPAATTKKSVQATPARAVTATTEQKYNNLNRWNKIMAMLHALQGVAVLVLSDSRIFPVTTNYVTTDPLASAGGQPVLVNATRTLFDLNVALLVAGFFFMSAIAHLLIATVYRQKYETNLARGMNKARWIEYGLSASTMMVAIAVLVGVSDLASLAMIFCLTLIMNLTGLMMEVHNQTTPRTNWLSFWIGTKAGIVPWLVVALYLWGSNVYGSGNVPAFVYWIFVSMFLFFSSFAVNMYLQYKKRGKWADYLYGERAYMILSLVAKTVLAWQVFFGTLRP